MKKRLLEIAKRLTNTGTIVALVSYIVLILVTLGFDVPKENVEVIVGAVCSIGILLGIFNKDGMDTTEWNK